MSFVIAIADSPKCGCYLYINSTSLSLSLSLSHGYVFSYQVKWSQWKRVILSFILMPDSANLDVVVHDFSFKIEVNNSLITFSFLPSLWLAEMICKIWSSTIFNKSAIPEYSWVYLLLNSPTSRIDCFISLPSWYMLCF